MWFSKSGLHMQMVLVIIFLIHFIWDNVTDYKVQEKVCTACFRPFIGLLDKHSLNYGLNNISNPRMSRYSTS